ncbi:hypothetical protein IJ114_01065 [Candidatus Saccharibacteria bacterium]|nr:hypothetical protein [Candidatus Saccharibacteria bacterium]
MKMVPKLSAFIFKSKHSTIILAMIIFLCWLPALIMLYPGTMVNDSWGQLNQVMNLRDNSWTISAHHPVFDSAYMSIIILPAARLFGNWHVAFFIYVLLQAIFTSLAFAYSITYFRKNFGQNTKVSLIFLLVYCFFPIFVSSVQTISKDALFAWIYLLFIIGFIEILRTKGACLKRQKFMVIFLTVCFFCILSKKAGAYVMLGSLIMVLIFQKENRKKLLVPILAVFGLNFILLPVFRYTFHIEESGTQEMLSLPFQQTARLVKDHPDSVTAEEKAVISKVLEYDTLAEDYNPSNADPVKGYEARGEKSDYANYLKVWLSQGLRFPGTYLAATVDQLAGWFSFSLYMPLTNMDWHTQQNDYYIPESATERSAFFKATSSIFDNVYQFIYNIPVIGFLLTFCFLATVLPYFIIVSLFVCRKATDKKYYLLSVPVLLSLIIGCYLAPVSTNPEGVRYLYPITYTTPAMLMLITYLYSEKKARKAQTPGDASAQLRPKLSRKVKLKLKV